VNALGKDLLLYEATRLRYTKPAKVHTYKPDFMLPNGIIVEVKGYMDLDARKKYVALLNSIPDLDIRFVFDKASTPIRKGSKITYGIWATNNGFEWSEKKIPAKWFTEPLAKKSLHAIFTTRVDK